LQNIERFTKDVKSFQLGKPFNPVEQLMAVLPSDSAHAIPKAARWFMTDPESPILDFYPKDVPVDPNGKAMPWLWVVLLPFIEEERLLSALSSTITKWTKAELLCNARGLDDGYMYVHSSHSLRPKLANVLQAGKTAKDPKTRLNDGAVYGCGGFSGSLRPPLSNELVPMEDEDVKIPPPPGADTIDDPSPDNLFLEEISPNESICVAFTEPIKLPHKSILLAGAKPPKAILTDDDKRIRKPRINRGASIANMGVSNGKSFQSGYGSMNISSYERDLAQRTGRGQQMNQAGTRTWGSMEPSGKRPRVDHLANPFQGGNQQQQQQQQQRGNYNGQGPPQQQGNYNGQGYRGNRGPPPPHQQYQQQGYQGNRGPPPQQYQQQQQHHQQQRNYPPGQPYQNRPPGNYGGGPPRGPPQQQQQQQQRGPPYEQQQQHPQQRGRCPPPPPQQSYSFRPGSAPPPPQRSRTSADTMKSLRAQLSSTLQQQNKRPPQG
jgi:5'-3' exoribonuclease 2